jgi:hypothetical protein
MIPSYPCLPRNARIAIRNQVEMSRSEIKLAVVLAETNQLVDGDQPRFFSLQYVKTDGTVGRKERVTKSGKGKLLGATKGNGNFRINVKSNGVLLLYDCVKDRPFLVKIHLLTHFNGIRIRH